MQLGDQRRGYLATLIQLVERASDSQILATVLGIVRKWVLASTDPFPTTKEKATLTARHDVFRDMSPQANPGWAPMSAPDNQKCDKLFCPTPCTRSSPKEYLTLVAEIYSQPRFSRSELTMRLENAFLLGLKCWDHSLRNRFLSIFDGNLPRPLVFRLNYFFKTQNWESLSDFFWLQQCIPLPPRIDKDRIPPLSSRLPLSLLKRLARKLLKICQSAMLTMAMMRRQWRLSHQRHRHTTSFLIST